MAQLKYDSGSPTPTSSHSNNQMHSPHPSSDRSHHSHSHSHSHTSPHQQSQSQSQSQSRNNSGFDFNYSDSDDDKCQNDDQARSTVIGSSHPSSNTWTIMQRNQRQQSHPSHQSQPPQQPSRIMARSSYQYDKDDINDQRSMAAVSTVAPARQPYTTVQRPNHVRDLPLSHAKPIQLTVNAISAKPVMHGILYRYNVRFHESSDDPNEADIPESNRATRWEVIRVKLFQDIRKIYGKFDFDNTIIYCDKKILDTQTFPYEISDDEKGNTRYHYIRIQYNAELDFQTVHAIREFSHEYLSQIVHIMHREIMQKIGYVQFGRSHYINPDKIHSLNIREYPYLEAMHGFLCTLEYTDMSTILFFRNKLRLKEKRTVVEIMQKHWDESQAYEFESEESKSQKYHSAARKELKGRYFITLYRRRCIRRINGVNFNLSLDSSFKRKEEWVTFRDYYMQIYNQELTQNFPGLLEVVNRNGSKAYYPPELCYLTGYPDKLRTDKKITGIIARNTSIPLANRIGNFEELIKKLNRYNQMNQRQQHRMVSEQNVIGHTRSLEYGQNMLQIGGHRLEPVTIIYNSIQSGNLTLIGDDQLLRKLRDVRGYFHPNVGNNGDLHCTKWGIAYFMHSGNNDSNSQSDRYCFEQLSQTFAQFQNEWFPNHLQNSMDICLDMYPMEIVLHSPFPTNNNIDLYLKNIIHNLEDAIMHKRVEGIVFILPSICGRDDALRTQIYSTVKALCNVKTGTITQCIRAQTISPMNGHRRGGNDYKSKNKTQNSLRGTFRQFMVKLGAIPWKLMLNDSNQINYLVDGAIKLDIPTMIIGIDVNHNRRKGVSTVGFISTYEPDFCRIMAQIDYQCMGQEVVGIQQMQMLTENALRNFQNINGVSPQQIFVYRDGVSLGELKKVTKKELLAIKQAALNVSQNCPQPKIQFMVVQKRVNARFFEWNNGNGLIGAKPRVIVDKEIVSTVLWDFYLIACGAPRDKVANPVRVIIIHDGLKLGERSKNDIELFTYALCNLYFGWGGAVKTPHVIKYADKIAELYSQTVDYMQIVHQQDNVPFKKTGFHLTHHFL